MLPILGNGKNKSPDIGTTLSRNRILLWGRNAYRRSQAVVVTSQPNGRESKSSYRQSIYASDSPLPVATRFLKMMDIGILLINKAKG